MIAVRRRWILGLAVVIAGLCVTRPASAGDFDPFEGPAPLAVFIQSNPWAMVIGSDTPRVAVYDNGEVIFAKKLGDRLAYHRVVLDKHGLDRVRQQIAPVLRVKGLKGAYDVRPNVTDQPEAMFYLCDGERQVATSVYGLMAPETELPGYTELPGSGRASPPPEEVLKLHKWLCALDYADSREWVPRYVEVMLWSYSYAPEASIVWPKDWPSLKSGRAIRRGASWSIFLDGSLVPRLREFLATSEPKGAVEVDGKKMAASYRFTFPGEPTWRKAFAAAAEAEQGGGK